MYFKMQNGHQTLAEVFSYLHPRGHLRCMVYRRFSTLGEAVQYAAEELPSAAQLAAIIEVNEIRIDHKEFRKLYKEQKEGLICRGRKRRARNGRFRSDKIYKTPLA